MCVRGLLRRRPEVLKGQVSFLMVFVASVYLLVEEGGVPSQI